MNLKVFSPCQRCSVTVGSVECGGIGWMMSDTLNVHST